MPLVKSSQNVNITFKIGDRNIGTSFPMGGYLTESALNTAIDNIVPKLSQSSGALVATITKTHMVNTDAIPQDVRGTKTRTYKFRVYEGNPAIGEPTRMEVVTVKVPEFKGSEIDHQELQQALIANIRVFDSSDAVQLLGVY